MVEKGQINPKFAELTSATSLVEINRIAKHFPRLLRTLNLDNQQGEQILLEPKSGSMTSFGVYFWALNRSSSPQIPDNKDFLLIETAKLLSRQIFSSTSLKGVLVFPSSYYAVLSQEYSRRFPNPFDADCAMYKENLILNLSTTQIGTPPIFTVPWSFQLDRRLFNRR